MLLDHLHPVHLRRRRRHRPQVLLNLVTNRRLAHHLNRKNQSTAKSTNIITADQMDTTKTTITNPINANSHGDGI